MWSMHIILSNYLSMCLVGLRLVGIGTSVPVGVALEVKSRDICKAREEEREREWGWECCEGVDGGVKG